MLFLFLFSCMTFTLVKLVSIEMRPMVVREKMRPAAWTILVDSRRCAASMEYVRVVSMTTTTVNADRAGEDHCAAYVRRFYFSLRLL